MVIIGPEKPPGTHRCIQKRKVRLTALGKMCGISHLIFDLNLLVQVINDKEAHIMEKDPQGEDQLREIKKKVDNSLRKHYLNKFLPVPEKSSSSPPFHPTGGEAGVG